MDTTPTFYEYALDGSDAIVSLGDAWLQFARENGAPGLTREAVLGTSVWEYIAGDSTREIYELLFRRVRDEVQPIVLPFRCDSADRFRFMELEIAPGEGRALRLRGRLLREQLRPHFKLLDRFVRRSSEPLPICSVCLRVELFGTSWVEAEEAATRLDLFGASELPPLEYRICADCVRAAREAPSAAAEARH